MIKRWIVLIMLVFTFCPSVHAEDTYIAGEEFFNNTAQEISIGSFTLKPTELLNKGLNAFLKEMRESSDVMVMLIVLGALSGILAVLKNAISDPKTAEGAFFACFTLMTAVAVKGFSLAMGYATEVIGAMTDFITKLSPIFMGLLATSGGIASATAFHPILSAAVYVITVIMKQCIFPLVQFGAVLSIVNNVSGRVQISGFNTLVHSSTKWILAAVLTIFAGITAVYGFSTPVLDGLSARTVKFAVGSLVPVVGGLLTDAVETVVGGTLVMKNAVGTAGMLAVCAMCVVPVLKISVIGLMFKFTGAVLEPMADRRITGLIQDISSAVTTLLAIVITVAVLFMICISIILASTNMVAR